MKHNIHKRLALPKFNKAVSIVLMKQKHCWS